MTHLDIDTFKSRLLEMRTELRELDTLSKDSTATVVLDQSSVGRLSRMDAMQGQQMALEAERRRRQELNRIEAALIRIENDEFGFCTDCGVEIAVGRLTINPTAVQCVTCAD